MNATSRPGEGEREELARLLPAPAERDLPNGRHQLLKELVMTQIRQEPQPAVPPPRRRSWRHVLTRRRVVVGAVVAGAVVTAVVLGPLGPGSQPGSRLGPQPAYAVTGSSDGTVTVRIHDLRDPAQLESALARRGINADIAFADRPGGRLNTKGPHCPLPSARRVTEIRRWRGVPGQDQQFKIFPALTKTGRTIIVRIYPKEIQVFVGAEPGPCTVGGKAVPSPTGNAPTRASTSRAPNHSTPGG